MVWREREEGGVVRIIADNGRDCIGKEKTKTPRKQLVYKFKIKNFYYVHIFIPILQQAVSRFNTKKSIRLLSYDLLQMQDFKNSAHVSGQMV